MKKSKHSETEIVKAVNQLDSGLSTDVICREYVISRATLYNWRSKYSGMDSSHIKRLKELEEENRRLKQMYADLALDNKILKDVIEKNYRARGKERDCSRNNNGWRHQHHSGMQVSIDSSFIFLLY